MTYEKVPAYVTISQETSLNWFIQFRLNLFLSDLANFLGLWFGFLMLTLFELVPLTELVTLWPSVGKIYEIK